MNGSDAPPHTPVPEITVARPRAWFAHPVFLGLALLLAVGLVYQPVWHAGYIWDDDLLITKNPCVVGPLGLREIWTTKEADICPLTISVFWTECRLWGVWPLPYHVASVLLHAACALLLWRVLRGMRVPGAWLGAALWALHPAQVESVAWITETKNTLSGVFYLLSILCFLRWQRSGEPGVPHRAWPYALTLACAALAMTAKSSTAVLPVVFCLLAWWQEGRWRGRNWRVIGPVLLMAVAAGIFSVWTQGQQMSSGGGESPARSLPQRVAGAGDAVWFYLGKLAWPHPLMTIYPRWDIDAGRWYAFLPGLAVAVVWVALWRKRWAWTDGWLLAFTYFLVALSPVLGLIEMGFTRHSLVADHFLYLASMAPAALAGAGIARWRPFRTAGAAWRPAALGAAVLMTLGWVSWQRTFVYKDQETLWADELARNARCWAAYEQLGGVSMEQGRYDTAAARFGRAVEINPGAVNARGNLGNCLLQAGHTDEAIATFRAALHIDDHVAFIHTNLGVALMQKGRVEESVIQYQEALSIDPGYADAYNDMGTALMQKGQWDAAADEYRLSLKADPGHPNVGNNLVLALARGGHADAAVTQYREASKRDSRNAEVPCAVGVVLAQNGRVDEAIAAFQEAVKIDPGHVGAHNNLGVMLMEKGRVAEAIIQYQELLQLVPGDAVAHDNLGLALVRNGRLAEASDQFRAAVSLKADFREAQAHLDATQALIQRAAESR